MTAQKLRQRTFAIWGNRDALCPLIKLKHGGHIHHTTYRRFDHERLFTDLIPLSPASHTFVHLWLGWGRRVRTQRLGKYPNVMQRIVHLWCRLMIPVCWILNAIGWILRH